MNTAEERIASRIYEIKEWLLKHEKQYDLSSINEKRVKYQLELKNIESKHHEEPFVVITQTEKAQNE
ncbi:MAG: hypothetical protein ACKO7N_00940 [Candidatus Nitrosotenuis sp.]